MAVIIKGVPPDLPPGIHRVLIRPVRNRKGFRILEGELVEPPIRRVRVELEYDGDQAVNVFKHVGEGGEGVRLRIGCINAESMSDINALAMLLEAVGCDVVGSESNHVN